jgi:UDP-glucose:(heptosyl)LPS alpha-1,3-glucosyltransferase
MKIAVIRQKYVNYGGAESFIQQYTEQLANLGHEVTIFASQWTASSLPNIHMRSLPTLNFNSLVRTLSFARAAKRAVRRESFDIIQSHEKTLCQDVYRAGDGCHREWLRQRSKNFSIPKKFLQACSPFHRLILDLEKKLVLDPGLKKIVAISEMVRQDILRHYPVPENKIQVVYNGVPLERFHPDNKERYRSSIREQLKVSDSEILILFVGSGFERKGLKFLLQSLKDLQVDNWRLVIMGKGKRARFIQHADECFHGKINFVEPVDDIEKYYAAADMFVLPSIYEPFGNAYLEALATGLPVIASGKSGAAEIIDPGVNGLVVEDPTDPGEIARQMNDLMDGQLRDEMGRRARVLAEKFSPEKNVQEMLGIYQEIVRAG